MTKISILTVTYGNRFHFLKQVLERVAEEKPFEIIVVDNNSENKEEIESFIKNSVYENFKYIRFEENKGSAGGFGAGMEYFINTEGDYLSILDDDNLIDKGFSNIFLSALELFPKEKRNKVILLGRREYVSESLFYNEKIPYSKKSIFGYNLFNPKSVFKLFKKHLFKRKIKSKKFTPIFPEKSIAWGGSFFSKDSIKEIGLPLECFFTYADDTEYAARAISKNHEIYQLYLPLIIDIDKHNRSENFLSVFSKESSDFRAFYSFRNNTFVTLYSYKANLLFFIINTSFLLLIYNILFITKYGFKKILFHRDKIIIRGIRKGIKKDFSKF